MQVVQNRVDALVPAFRVRMGGDVKSELAKRGAVANVHGRAAFKDPVGGEWSMRVPRGSKGSVFWLTREEHVTIDVDLKGPGGHTEQVEFVASDESMAVYDHETGEYENYQKTEKLAFDYPGWNVALKWSAQYLAEKTVAEVLTEGRELASRFGRIFEERLRRVDMCADVAGWEIKPEDFHNFVRRSRVGVVLFAAKLKGDDGFRGTSDMMICEHELPALHDAYGKRVISGLRFGSGDVVARNYDKLKELSDLAAPEKREREYERMRRGGWDGCSPVARTEFQLRGEALKELGIREPKWIDETTGDVWTLDRYLSRIWATCLDWLQLTIPGQSRRTKEDRACALDPRWRLLHDVLWNDRYLGDRKPIKRQRLRGYASAAQAIGALISHVGAEGCDFQNFPEEAHAYAGRPEVLREMVKMLLGMGEETLTRALVDRFKNEEHAAAHLAVCFKDARARFALARGAP